MLCHKITLPGLSGHVLPYLEPRSNRSQHKTNGALVHSDSSQLLLYSSSENLVIWLVKKAGLVLTVPAKITVPGAQSIEVERVLCSSRKSHIDERNFSQPAGHALFTARSFFLSTEREYFIEFPKIFEIFRRGKPTLNHFLRKPAYVGTLFYT